MVLNVEMETSTHANPPFSHQWVCDSNSVVLKVNNVVDETVFMHFVNNARPRSKVKDKIRELV